jgi:hypothetical protein
MTLERVTEKLSNSFHLLFTVTIPCPTPDPMEVFQLSDFQCSAYSDGPKIFIIMKAKNPISEILKAVMQ